MTSFPEATNEGLIDKRIEQAAKWYGDSDTTLKCAAIAAARVVGKYDGATAEIAKRTRRSVSTVENWAHAKWMYDHLRETNDKQVARNLWHWLPISHWWLAWEDIHQRGGGALYYLSMADTHGWSGRRMLQEFRVDYEREHGAPPPARMEQVYSRGVSVLQEFLSRFSEVDAVIAELSQKMLNRFAELGVVKQEEG